ncbi:hypothetical protein D3C76_1448840 [compost metagenome]
MDPVAVDAGKIWPDGFRTGRQNQRIIALPVFAAFFAADKHGFGGRIDPDHFALGADIDVKPAMHRFRRLNQKFRAILDRIADIVGKPAVSKRNVGVAFKHDDMGFFIQAAKSCGRRSSASNAADY